MSSEFLERVALFGGTKAGIVTVPTAGHDETRPVLVVLNTGISHRVGHHRMHVELCRAVARQGTMAVRFDFRGIGDSAPLDGADPGEGALADIGQVLRELGDRLGARRFVLCGLCSGADQSLRFASRDDRVAGVVLIDPQVPRTRRHRIAVAVGRLRMWGTWRNLILGRSRVYGRLFRPGSAPKDETSDEYMDRQLNRPESRDALGRCFAAAIDRGVKILAVFTTEERERWSYRGQLFDAFPTVPLERAISLVELQDADHLLSRRDDRAKLIETVTAWLGSWTERPADASVAVPRASTRIGT